MVTNDILLSNGPVMAEYGNVRNVAVIEVPVQRCDNGNKHNSHRYEDKYDIRKWRPEDTWKYCPGRS